ncbi:hypothetical protein [Candidatus Methanoperedens nitratireducens]|uniref:Uncharacterized protein n=1 Tax=Candidatus Methanoperedens nitratireducens TaxID=1392998 RepID=A0A284VQ76_9EURY|nr:hypothetical protein [Candidatus Methanoperedens nitroreducens]SNQ61327.1 exported hypothetical protein [Candidatus Methanoperedens nitroreducens]
MKKILLIAIVLSMVFAGCISGEKKPQGANFHGVNLVYDATSSLGASENQTQLQRLDWRVNITNASDKAAKSANASVMLHPEIVHG